MDVRKRPQAQQNDAVNNYRRQQDEDQEDTPSDYSGDAHGSVADDSPDDHERHPINSQSQQQNYGGGQAIHARAAK